MPVPVSAEALCSLDQAEPGVSLKTTPGRVVYNHSKNRAQISGLQSKRGGAGSKRGWHPIGLTVAELQFRMQISVNVLSRAENIHCANVGDVQASLGFDRINVYVDKRYRRDSCPYRSILQHEQEHVEIFRNALAVYAPKVERRLTEAAARLRPVKARSAQEAADKLQKTLQREMQPLFKEINAAIDADNDSIDTVENYKREQARCSTW